MGQNPSQEYWQDGQIQERISHLKDHGQMKTPNDTTTNVIQIKNTSIFPAGIYLLLSIMNLFQTQSNYPSDTHPKGHACRKPDKKCFGHLNHTNIQLMEEILYHMECIKPCKSWDRLSTNTSVRISINYHLSILSWLFMDETSPVHQPPELPCPLKWSHFKTKGQSHCFFSGDIRQFSGE